MSVVRADIFVCFHCARKADRHVGWVCLCVSVCVCGHSTNTVGGWEQRDGVAMPDNPSNAGGLVRAFVYIKKATFDEFIR